MKVWLMHPGKDFPGGAEPPAEAQDLVRDLGLQALFSAMAGGDRFLGDIAEKAVLSSLPGVEEILFRQAVLKDCLAQEEVVRGLYALAVEVIESERKQFWGGLTRSPGFVLHRSVELLRMFVGYLRKLRKAAEEQKERFESAGFQHLFGILIEELSDDYFAEIEAHLKELGFRGGVLISAFLGPGNQGRDYVLRQPNAGGPGWLGRLIGRGPDVYTYRLHPKDEAGGRMLSLLRDRGINLVADALARSTDHILSFFTLLRAELAFYVGCLNLSAALAAKGQRVSFPRPAIPGRQRFSCRGLYDVALQLNMQGKVVGNDIAGDEKEVVIISGANQGGKSTFLRSVGQAWLMMQSGMFVAADAFEASVASGFFSHFKREEDATMQGGKLDEELARMAAIAGRIRPAAVMLFNEAFAATNEREGSEIAGGIVCALLDCGIRVFFVTHMYDFANDLAGRRAGKTLLLRAERTDDGRRTFRMIEAPPLATSFGIDLYRSIFGPENEHEGAGDAPGHGRSPQRGMMPGSPPARRRPGTRPDRSVTAEGARRLRRCVRSAWRPGRALGKESPRCLSTLLWRRRCNRCRPRPFRPRS